MNALGLRRPSPLIAATVAAAGCGALVLRPFLGALTRDATPLLLLLFTALLIGGVLWPDTTRRQSARAAVSVAATVAVVGVAAFVAARVLVPGQVAAPFGARPLLLDGFAAIAEEAFFRRLVFAALLTAAAGPDGDVAAIRTRRFAIGGSAALFAIVHVSVYGFGALPIDLAAGLLLSWQRDAAGTWTVPAITHVVANALAVI